jgi:hypothetical protein
MVIPEKRRMYGRDSMSMPATCSFMGGHPCFLDVSF